MEISSPSFVCKGCYTESLCTTEEIQFARDTRPPAVVITFEFESRAQYTALYENRMNYLPLRRRKHTSTFCSTKNLLSRPPLKEMGPSTGVSPNPPRRQRVRTCSTRFFVATSMRWKFIVPTRTCRVRSLLRFDGKKWSFSHHSDSSSPLPFPDRSFFNRFKRPESRQWLGVSMHAYNIGRDLHFRWDRYRDADLPVQWRSASILNCLNCSAASRVHKDRVEWVRSQLDPPATFSLLDSVSKRAVVDKRWSLREDSVKRYMHDLSEKFATPKMNLLHLPQHTSQLEARKPTTTTLNSKKKERKRTGAIVRSLFAISAHLCSPRGTIAVLDQRSVIFHCTIAQHRPNIFMAQISRHALTDLSAPGFIWIFQAVRDFKSFPRVWLNFQRWPILCTTLYREPIQAPTLVTNLTNLPVKLLCGLTQDSSLHFLFH